MLIDRAQHRHQHRQELQVILRGIARIQEVIAFAVGHRPIQVFTAAVDARERLLVQEADQVMAQGDLFHQLHKQLVVVCGDVGLLEDRRELVLMGGDLVMPGDHRDPQLIRLLGDLVHIIQHPLLDAAEILVFQLLSLGGRRADERAAGHDQVLTQMVVILIDQEILLFRAAGRDHLFCLLVAEELQERASRLAQGFVRTQERQLFIERGAVIGDENSRDTEGVAEAGLGDEGRAGRIPGGVAARLKGRPDPSGRKGTRIRLPLDELGPGEFLDDLARTDDRDKTVVFFRGQPRHRLEPVGIERRPARQRPIFHRRGDLVCLLQGNSLPLSDPALECRVRAGGDELLHRLGAEGIFSEIGRDRT